MTPAEHILENGECRYCLTPINDNDRCGCDGETIWYLTVAVELLSEALRPISDAWEFQKDNLTENQSSDDRLHSRFLWKPNNSPGVTFYDIKRAHDALEQVELMV